jgi:hypothetical protein
MMQIGKIGPGKVKIFYPSDIGEIEMEADFKKTTFEATREPDDLWHIGKGMQRTRKITLTVELEEKDGVWYTVRVKSNG